MTNEVSLECERQEMVENEIKEFLSRSLPNSSCVIIFILTSQFSASPKPLLAVDTHSQFPISIIFKQQHLDLLQPNLMQSAKDIIDVDAQVQHQLASYLKRMEKYYLFVSVLIQHHQKSIATLPQPLAFAQLKNRVELLIDKSRQNVKMLTQIFSPYQQIALQSLISQKKAHQEMVIHGHHHEHDRLNHHQIVNMFYQMAFEWANNEPPKYIQRILAYLQAYQQSQPSSVAVVGCGMGRSVYQIHNFFQASSIKAYEEDFQQYISAQYFLNRYRLSLNIYPYVHNFSNVVQSEDPYRSVKVPWNSQQQSNNFSIVYGSIKKGLSNETKYDILISTFNSYHIKDVIKTVKLMYQAVKEGGLWIDVNTANFQKNKVPLSYRQYQKILQMSPFKLLIKDREQEYWYKDDRSLMNQRRVIYYRVMRK